MMAVAGTPHLRETLACAAMVAVLLALALRASAVSAAAPSAAPPAELSSKPPRVLRELAAGLECLAVCPPRADWRHRGSLAGQLGAVCGGFRYLLKRKLPQTGCSILAAT